MSAEFRGTECYVARDANRKGRLKLLCSAHIVIGMGTLEAVGMLGGQPLSTAVAAALLFCTIAILYALAWSRFFDRGPIETAMRKIAG